MLAASSENQLLQDLSTAMWLFAALGFIINIPKSVTVPTQCLEFLGFVINTQTMTIALPSQKIHSIQKEAVHLLSLDAVQMRTLAHFIGTLVATRPAVPTGPLHYRALQDLKIRTLHQSSSYQMVGQINKQAQVDLQWWATQLPTCCSSPIVKQEATIVIESDASNSGWGAVCQGVRTGGRWTPVEAQHHINYLELKAVFLAMQSFLKTKNGTNVLIRSDNRTTIAYINKMGGPAMTQLCSLALQIWQWCLARQITPHAEYLAGRENVIADWESRHHDSSDWQLLPSIFDGINNLLGPFNLDLFASRTNAQLPEYYSWRPDPYAKTVDAFTVSWSQDQPYLFPPFNLIGRALTKIQTDLVKYACLIVPAWPAQVWYPQVLQMLVKYPVLLPMEQDLLLNTDQNPHPLVLEGRMYLAAWPISGRPMLCKVFQSELQNCSYNPGEQIPTRLTTQPGLSGVAGVIKDKCIPFQHL